MSTTVWQRTITALLLAVVVSLGLAVSTGAQPASRSVSWQRYDVDLQIQTDGTLAVTETQAITFTGTYQQGYRLVPLDRVTGANNVSVAEVTNGQTMAYTRGTGQPNTYSATLVSGGLQIDWWFSPTPAQPSGAGVTRQFVLRYTVTGAIRIYDAGDQLQWRAIYADRDGTVGPSTVTVHLPADASTDAVKSAWYGYPSGGSVGALPQTAAGTLSDARSVQFTIGQLPTREGAEVRVQFPHGLIPATPPAWQAQADRADWLQQTLAPIGAFLSLLLTLGILAGGAAILMLLWMSMGRDPAVGAVPPRLTEPPSDLPAPLAGILVDEVASERQVVAALVDLADRGLVHLADEQNPQLVGSQQDVRVTLTAALNDARLRPYERVLLAALFGPSPTQPVDVLLSSVNQQFMAAIPSIESRLYEAVAREGLFVRNPEATRRRYRAVGVGLSVAGLGLSVGAAIVLGGVVATAALPGLALGIVGVALVWLAGRMARRTQPGALEAAKWRAFRGHLADTAAAEKPATALPPHYLAYAVAFAVDQEFVHHLESVGAPAPRWHGGWSDGPGGIVVMPGGWYGGGPWMGSSNGHQGGLPDPRSGFGGVAAPPSPNPQGWSDALAGLLNAASETLSQGGGSGGWSGGGFGGGGGGGGGGGFR